MSEIGIFRNFWKFLPKSIFFSKIWLTLKIYRKFDWNRKKIKFITKFDQTQNFSKICPKSKFFEFSKFSKISENFQQNWNFSKICTEIEIFRIFRNFRKFPRIFYKIEIFRKFAPKSKFFENLTQIEIFLNFRKNRNFSKIWQKRFFFENST